MEILGKDGRYELREPIGERAVASVHHAIDLRRRVPVIVKRFAPSAHRTAYAEIVAALKRADIPGVVLPLEIVLSHDPAPFAVYAALPGASLASALGDGAMQWARAAEIVFTNLQLKAGRMRNVEWKIYVAESRKKSIEK